jgi:hypothetical protein
MNEEHRHRWLYMKIAQFIQANRQLAIAIALVIGLFVAILFSVYLSIAAWIGDGFGTCGTEVVQEVVSPQGHLVAAQYERNCGATTDYVNGVAIRRPMCELRTSRPNRCGFASMMMQSYFWV